jgi:hypothetical protein
MTTPTRYDLHGEYDCYIEEDSEGDYVLYDDYEKLKAQNMELLAAYAEAIDDIASWACYASDYFQQKHDLAGCLKRHNDRLDIAKAGDV